MTLGLKDLFYAICTEKDGVESYGLPKKLAEAMSADLSVKTATADLYADDAISESVKLSDRTLHGAQLPGAAVTAFLHGAQDGQKFLGVFLLGSALAQGREDEGTFLIPVWLMALCALFMALGTLMGGRRIIDTVGREMVSLGPREGLAADLGNIACLLCATLLGLPVSTTHTRTCALLGAGSAGGSRPDRAVAGRIALAWVLTFPGCMAIGYWMAKVFLAA